MNIDSAASRNWPIAINTPPITTLLADFTQTTGGPTTLIETTTPGGTGSVAFSKTGNMTNGGPNEILYSPAVASLIVSEAFTVEGDSNVSAIQDTFIQDIAPIPEPASLGFIGAALLGIGFARRRRNAA